MYRQTETTYSNVEINRLRAYETRRVIADAQALIDEIEAQAFVEAKAEVDEWFASVRRAATIALGALVPVILTVAYFIH